MQASLAAPSAWLALEAAPLERIPKRNILDMLANVGKWLRSTILCLGPPLAR
jgi:hypothetical protein